MKKSETTDFTVKFVVFAQKLNGDKYKINHFTRVNHECAIDREYGWSNYISLNEILGDANEFLKDGHTLTLGLKVCSS